MSWGSRRKPSTRATDEPEDREHRGDPEQPHLAGHSNQHQGSFFARYIPAVTVTELSPRQTGRGSLIVGFVVGLAVILLIGGLWLRFGSPFTWPSALSIAVRNSLQERRGEEVYNANCLSCHGGPTGGSITDSPPRHNANGHTWHHPDCALRQMVREGSGGIFEVNAPDAPKMQPFKDRLSSEDIDAALAYIKTMWTPGQRQLQRSFTQEMCFEGQA